MEMMLMISGILGAVILLLLIWRIPKWQVKRNQVTEEKWKAENEFRKTLLQGLGGLVVLVSLYFTWMQMGNNQTNFKNQLNQVQEGNRLTRFTHAIDFLSKTESTQRIGGIYTLEQIANESPDKYMETVVNVIAAFVRKSKAKEIGEDQYKIEYEVNIAMTALGRVRREEKTPKINLSNNINVIGVNLSNANFCNTDFTGADLRYVDFRNGKFHNAIFCKATLNNAKFNNSELFNANFSGDETEIVDAEFKNASLQDANFSKAALSGVDFENARLDNADLHGARINYANLKGTVFIGANLSEVNFNNSNGLKAIQLMEAKTLFNVYGLPEDVKNEVERRRPDLFEKPELK